MDYVLLGWWDICYWMGTFLGYFVIPLQQGYVMAGEFSAIERIQRSFKMNVPIFLVYFISFIALLLCVYFFGRDENGNNELLDQQGILAIIVALSLTFGFVLLILFLGYGLVKIPVQTWLLANMKEKQNRMLFKVANYERKIKEQRK